MDDFIPNSHSSEELAARRDMITLIRRSYRQGLFTATHGTYSVRLEDDSFLITPSAWIVLTWKRTIWFGLRAT